jgi:carbamoyltransferase
MTAARDPEWVLGLGGSSHDFSAALMRDNDIRVAIETERVNRVKHGRCLWYQDPLKGAIDYCLQTERIGRDQISVAVSNDLLPIRARRFMEWLGLTLYPHHLCHAASVAMMLPPNSRAGILVYDGMGSIMPVSRETIGTAVRRETFSFYRFESMRLTCLGATVGEGHLEHVDYTNGVTNSIGLLYELVTVVLGFHPDEVGKTMGLAGWGKPRFLDCLMQFVQLGDSMDDAFRFDPFDGRFESVLVELLNRERGTFQVRADLAASLQHLFNLTLLNLYGLIRDSDIDYVGIAGGCALNSVANGALARHIATEGSGLRLLIPPYASDSGLAFGALWLWRHRTGNYNSQITFRSDPIHPRVGRPGRVYTKVEAHTAASKFYPRLVFDGSVSTPEHLARMISGGRIVGLFQGGSEIGPRALGGRSILADPRSVLVRERINRSIKLREPFRPLAPMVLAGCFDEYFHPACAKDYYMLTVADATERCLRDAPAVVHVDGGARVQVVDESSDQFLFRLLTEFHRLTNVPILLNTSFNRRGEPIVETPEQAVGAFLDMRLDGLYLEDEFWLLAP